MAQTVAVYDFEDGDVSGFGNYGGGETVVVEAADNPSATDPNVSAKVLKFEAPGEWKGANLWKDEGVFAAKPLKISLLVYATNIDAVDLAELKIKLDMRNSISDGDITEKYLGDPIAADTWVALEYDVSGLEVWDYQQFAFQNHVAGTYYFDDITITYEGEGEGEGEGEVGIYDLLIDFEDVTLGHALPTLNWPLDEEDPDPSKVAEAIVAIDPLDAENKVLQFTPKNYNAAPVLSFTLPEGMTLADYSVFEFKGHFAAGDVGWKHIMVTVTQHLPSGPFDNAESEGVVIGDFNREKGATTAWETIEIDVTNELSDLTGTIFVAFGMNQDGKDGETVWYVDDIVL